MDKKNIWLGVVAKQHQEWIKVINGFGEFYYAEDLVQEMYLALNKYANEEKVIKNGVVSRGYIFFTLRSLYFKYYKAKNKIKKYSIDDKNFKFEIPDHSHLDEQIAFHKICELIDGKLDTMHWYDKKLFSLYKNTDLSLRAIAKETKISWVSIFISLKSIKLEIKQDFQEDWDNYKNEDYERL
jgi:predicted DNA-binding protein YlxM (UPF0122 family)|tara:strand:- start:1473 stop:2021 length:549 start_codon:yes stop_codon:yes gene_type:complete